MKKITAIIKIKKNTVDYNTVDYIDEIVIPFETRQKSRFKVTTKGNEEVGFFLQRGHILRDNDRVSAEDGTIYKITAANEAVCTGYSRDALLLTRASYHLGNRHIPLQIGSAWIRFQVDHVLKEMVENLGLQVEIEEAPFEPEPGAYFTGLNERKQTAHHHHDADDHGHSH
ncbi:MAG: urease accessory protein UreE [Pseudomonadales bacterium]|nr:urease accessory protein UreE [Pseudomonadales bacterium]